MTNIKIAVADDHTHFRTALVHSLSTLLKGVEVVIEAGDGQELLAQLHRYPVDLVLTDYSMPGLDRLNLLQALKKGFPTIPLIVMSFGNDPVVRESVLIAGAADFVPKNEDLPALYDLMVRAINDKKKIVLPSLHDDMRKW